MRTRLRPDDEPRPDALPPLTGKRRLLRPELAPEPEAGRAFQSTPSQLLAEVERLTDELCRAQSEVKRLEVLADEDALCGVLNRRGFEREFRRSLAHAARYGTPASLLLVDLDDFKTVNDRGGHLAGDAMLRAVAQSLAEHIRASDVLARLGGDEFAVILWHAVGADAAATAARLVAALPCGASFGLAELAGEDGEAVIRRADAELYAAKRAGKPLRR